MAGPIPYFAEPDEILLGKALYLCEPYRALIGLQTCADNQATSLRTIDMRPPRKRYKMMVAAEQQDMLIACPTCPGVMALAVTRARNRGSGAAG